MKIVTNTHLSFQNLIDFKQESYIRTAKKYLDHIISIIANYAPLITFWTTLLYTIPEIESYAIIADFPTTTTTPEPDQVDIRAVSFQVKGPCYQQTSRLALNNPICYEEIKKNNLCTIL